MAPTTMNGDYSSASPEYLSLSLIIADEQFQPRAILSQETINDYAQHMMAGVQFPPVIVFLDGTAYWLADGFHRVEAAKKAGQSTILAEVHQGDRHLAVLYAVRANCEHGLPRTNEDKRKAVEILLLDPQWGAWSNNEIARRCAVSPMTVKRVKDDLIYNRVIDASSKRVSQRHGKLYLIDTAKIGRSKDSENLPIVDERGNTCFAESPPRTQTNENNGRLMDSPSVRPAQQEFPTHAHDLALGEAVPPDNTMPLQPEEECEKPVVDCNRQGFESEEITAVFAQAPTLPLCVSTIEWEEPQQTESAQTLRFPLYVWVEGPSTLLPTLLQQIKKDPDARNLLHAKLNDSIKSAIADLVPQ